MTKSKSRYYDTQKRIFLDILFKITLLWCPKILMPEKIEKQTCTFKTWSNTLGFSWYQNRLLDAQSKLPHTILWLQGTHNRLPEANSWLIHVKKWYYDAQKNIFLKMYLRSRHGKITLPWFPKNTDNLWFFVKIKILRCPKDWKNMYLRRH